MAKLPYVIEAKDIIRGKIFRTAFPMLEERPLSFLENCPEHKKCKHFNTGQNYCGKIIEKPYGFDSGDDEVLLVVNRFKARYAIVLSTHILNQNPNWPNVIVVPIVGIHADELDKPRIKKIMKKDITMFTAYYLDPTITGMPCYIDLGKIRPVPKNWLLQEKWTVSDKEVFNGISERIGLLLAQKKLADCDKCKKPCEKCSLRDEVEQLKKQLEQIGA